MLKLLQFTYLALLALLVPEPGLLLADAASLSPDRIAGIRALLTPQKAEFLLREPVVVELVIENGSARAEEFDLGRNSTGKIELNLQKPDGLTATSRELPPAAGGAYAPGTFSLRPGKSYRTELLINDWFAFEQVGEYRLTVIVPSSFSTAETFELKTVIRVGPRDPKQLSRLCQSLEEVALSRGAESQSNAGRKLAVIADEACLPSYERVLRESTFAKEGAIAGLAGVGTNAAIDVIVKCWDQLRWDQQARARQEFEWHGKKDALLGALERAHKKLKPAFSDP